jgi:type I restriction enzyme, S subunit
MKHGYLFRAFDYTDSGDKVLKISQITNDYAIDMSDCSYVAKTRFNDYKDYTLSKNDIVMALSGSNIGKIAMILENPGVTFQNYQVGKFETKDESVLLSSYLFYFLCSNIYQNQLKQIYRHSILERISKGDIKRTELIIPPIKEQLKISKILSNYDQNLYYYRKSSNILETILHHNFQSRISKLNSSPEKHPKPKKLVGKTKKSKDLIRPSFKIGIVEDIAYSIRDITRPAQLDGETPYISVRHMPKKNISISKWGDVSGVKSYVLKFSKGDILLSKIRPNFHKVGIAPVEGVCSSNVLVIRPKDPICNNYLISLLSSEKFINYCISKTTGARMPRTNWEDIKKYQIIIPSPYFINKWNYSTDNIILKITENVHNSKILLKMRKQILNLLISSRVQIG